MNGFITNVCSAALDESDDGVEQSVDKVSSR